MDCILLVPKPKGRNSLLIILFLLIVSSYSDGRELLYAGTCIIVPETARPKVPPRFRAKLSSGS